MTDRARKGSAIALVEVPRDLDSQPVARPRLGLTELDKVAATALAEGVVDQLVEQVRSRADALTADPGDVRASRVRLISRRMATLEGHVELLEATIGKALSVRDFDAIPHLEHLR